MSNPFLDQHISSISVLSISGPRNEKDEKEEKEAKLPAPMPEDKQLFESRILLISAPIDAKVSHMVNTKLLALDQADEKKPVYVFINSPGGEIYSGFAIFDTIRFIRPPVYTIVSGLAASMGSLIALAAKKERRFALPNSKFLIHQPSVMGGLGGSASDIEIHAKDLLATKEKIIQMYADETGRKIVDIRDALDRDRWMNPMQAKEFGLISKIIASRAELPTT